MNYLQQVTFVLIINTSVSLIPLLNNDAPFAKYVTQQAIDTMPPELKMKLLNAVNTKNSFINRGLRQLAQQSGIDKKISMHISRHSFARAAKQKGTDNAMLKDMLAHSSIKVTEGYMGSFDTLATDRALANIFDKSSAKAELVALVDKMSEANIRKAIEILTTNYGN
jgi:integrase